MTDLISRQDAIRKCCGEKCGCEREECGYTEACLEVMRLESLPSTEQVTGKLKKPCNSLLTDDSDECKEQKSKLDLIRREDVTDILADLYWADERLLNFKTEIDAVYDKILALKSANAVDVVRCKDCMHYESDGGALMVCRIDDMVVDDTDYCSYGERREP